MHSAWKPQTYKVNTELDDVAVSIQSGSKLSFEYNQYLSSLSQFKMFLCGVCVVTITKRQMFLPFSIARTLMPFLLAYSKQKDTKVLPIEKVKILMPNSIASTSIPFLVRI